MEALKVSSSGDTQMRKIDSVAKRIRILLIDHTAELGGGELALLALVRQLNHERYEPIILLCAHGPLEDELRKAAETHVMPLNPKVLKTRKDTIGIKSIFLEPQKLFLSIRYIFRLARKIREINPDIIHTNSLKADILGGLAAKLARVPLIWHVRDRIEESYLPKPVVRIFRYLCRIMPEVVIANSESTLDILNLPKTQPSAAIYSGVDLERYLVDTKAEDKQFAQKVRSGSGPIRIGIIGRLAPWKGQEIFLRAAKEVHQRHPMTRFLIIGAALFGEQDYAEQLKKLTEDLGLTNAVEFTGFQKDIPNVIKNLDMVIHASTTPEPFGQVIVQGLAANKPVIATEGGGASEIIHDRVHGLLVPRGDAPGLASAICSYLDFPESAQEMATRGRRRVEEEFTIQQTTKKVEVIYDSLFTKTGNRSSMKCRILHYNTTASVSGAEVVLLNILRGLDRSQFESILICPEGALSEMAKENAVQVLHTPELKARFTWNPIRLARYCLSVVSIIPRLRSLVRTYRPDVVHANSIRAGIISTLATVGMGTIVEWHVHDMLPNHPITAIVRLIAASTKRNRFIAVSAATKRGFAGEHLKKRIETYSTVMLNGIDIRRYATSRDLRETVRAEYNILPDQFCIGHVGQFTQRKDQLGAVLAFKEVLAQIPNAVLLIVGKPVFEEGYTYYEKVQRAIQDLGLEGKVRLLGFCKDVPKLMQAFDLLVMNSINDPCPLTLLEAMAAGIPALGSNVDGIPELIQPGVTGWLTPAEDVVSLTNNILRVAAMSPEARMEIGSNARRLAAEQYSLERYVRQFAEFTFHQFRTAGKLSPQAVVERG